jgi:hypothetical protein
VLAQAAPGGGISAADFFVLTPDATGSYANGTWHTAASPPAGYAPWATNEAVLPDGRVLFVGGEYNRDEYGTFDPSGLTNMSALYDPVADTWTMLPAPPGENYIGDPAGVLLADGRYILGDKLTNRMFAFDPATASWSALPFTGFTTDFAEMGFTLLPGGAVLSADVRHAPKAWHFVPQTSAWVAEPDTPVNLTQQNTSGVGDGYGPRPAMTVGGVTYAAAPAGTYFPPGEIGPQMLRPDGTVWVVGAASGVQSAHSAIYHPGASAAQPGSWTLGPDLPNLDNADDASAALLVSGNVLLAGGSDALYEFNGTTIVRTRAPPPAAAGTFLLPLPSGQVLVLTPGEGLQARLYTPVGSPLAAWRPAIANAPATVARAASAQVTGTQFNGLSEAAKYGDEFDAATNYPLVRIRNVATGHVVYCRTHGYTMGVATGSALVTATFDVPAGAEIGASKLTVVANGIASAEADVTVL